MIELLRDAKSGFARVGVLSNANNPGSRGYLNAILDAGKPLQVGFEVYDVQRAEDIDLAFQNPQGNIQGMVVFPEAFFWVHSQAADC